MFIVKVDHLRKVYKSRISGRGIVALDKVSLSVKQGEIFALLGPNGAGKTTLFKILLGIARKTDGTAAIFGYSPDNPKSREKTGFLPENPTFPPHLSAIKLLQFTGRLYGMEKSLISKRIGELLELVGMKDRTNQNITKLSKGMLQRIGIAQAMMSNPDILFLDEPTDGIDALGKAEIKKTLRVLRDKGKTIFLNSHLLTEVESIADRVAILSKGNILKISSIENLTTKKYQYEIEADFKDRRLEIPGELGKIDSIEDTRMLITLKSEDNINGVIDFLRSKQVNIKTFKPLKVSLEDSFLETLKETN